MTIDVISQDGTSIAARRRGEGSPLVLVHGTGGGINSFGLVEDTLAQHHTVWVYDRRGRGQSGDTEPWSLDREVDDVLTILAAAGPEAHLFGHSFGAACAMAAAARQPSLRTLVLYEPPLHARRIASVTVERAISTIVAGDIEGGLDQFFTMAGITTDEAAIMRSIPQVWADLSDGIRVAPREMSAVYDQGWEPSSYRGIKARTLLLSGSTTDRDIYLTPQDLRDAIPGHKIATLTGQGHLGFAFDQPQFARALLAFIGRCDTSNT